MGQDEERQAIVKRAYLEIRQLRGQVEAEQERARARNEPIAIVGMSCRNLEHYFQNTKTSEIKS